MATTDRNVTPREISGKPAANRVNDACRRLGIGRTTLYEMARRGEIRLKKISGRTVVPESEIERLTAVEAA